MRHIIVIFEDEYFYTKDFSYSVLDDDFFDIDFTKLIEKHGKIIQLDVFSNNCKCFRFLFESTINTKGSGKP